MYLTVREYDEVRSLEEVGRRVRDDLVPILRRMAGFRAYYAVGADSGSNAFSITVFEEREAALDANEYTRAWAVAKLRDLVPSPPEVMGGEVMYHAALAPQARQRDRGYITLYRFSSVAPLPRVWPKLWEITSPPLARQPGFRDFYALASEAHHDRGVAVTVFDSRELAAAQPHLAVALAAEIPNLIPDPPTVTRGVVLAAAVA